MATRSNPGTVMQRKNNIWFSVYNKEEGTYSISDHNKTYASMTIIKGYKNAMKEFNKLVKQYTIKNVNELNPIIDQAEAHEKKDNPIRLTPFKTLRTKNT